MRLPIRVRPEPFESIWGWALRAAEANRYPSAHVLLRNAGFLSPHIRPRCEVINALAEAADATVEQIQCIVPLKRRGRGSSQTRLPMVEVPRNQLDLKSVRICPLCIRQTPALHAVWELRFWNACPIHNTLMLRSCPQCNTQISWQRPHLNECRNRDCRYKFSDYSPELAKIDDLILPAFLCNSLPSHYPSNSHSSLNEKFDNPSPAEVFRIINIVGIALNRSNAKSDTIISNICEAASKALSDWPASFVRFYRSLYTKTYEIDGSLVYHETRGRAELSKRVRNGLSEKSADIILNAIRNGSEAGSNTRFKDIEAVKNNNVRFISRHTAARMLDISPEYVDELFTKGTLRGYDPTPTDQRLRRFVSVSDVHEFKSTQPARFSRPEHYRLLEIAKSLGIGHRSAYLIKRSGFISFQQSRKGIYARIDATKSFLQSIIDKCSDSGPNIPDSKFVSIVRTKQRFNLPLDLIIRKILDEEIKPDFHCTRETGFRGIFFRRDTLIDLSASHAALNGAISREKAAKMLSVRRQDMKHLIDKGLVEEFAQKIDNRSSYICAKSLRKMQEHVVTSSFLSKVTRTKASNIRKKLLSLDAQLVLEISDHHTTSYWRWRDVSRVYPAAGDWKREYMKFWNSYSS